MTIGYILDDSLDRADGVQQAVLAIGEQMRKLGHDVHYIVSETSRTDIQNIHSLGSYWQLSFNGNSVRTPKPVSRRKVRKLFESVPFDVLHVQMPYSPFLAGRVLASAPKSVKIYGTFHILPYNMLASAGTRALGMMQGKKVRRFNGVYAVSKPAKVFLDRAYGCDSAVLPNPVQWSFYHGRRKVLPATRNVVFVGRFEQRKGVLQLVHAYGALPEELRDQTKLIMCGKGPLHETARKLATQLGLSVELPGFVSEEQKAEYLANAEIAVFPSISGESFGIVLVEAMSAGAGVTLGGDNPGYRSVMHPWAETLFDPTDQKAFTAILQKFLTDKPSADQIGQKQHQAAHLYDVEVICGELEHTYLATK